MVFHMPPFLKGKDLYVDIFMAMYNCVTPFHEIKLSGMPSRL